MCSQFPVLLTRLIALHQMFVTLAAYAAAAAAVNPNITCFDTGLVGDCSQFIDNFCSFFSTINVSAHPFYSGQTEFNLRRSCGPDRSQQLSV